MTSLYNDAHQANSKWTIVRRNQIRTVRGVRTDAREGARGEDDDAEKDGKGGQDCMRAEL